MNRCRPISLSCLALLFVSVPAAARLPVAAPRVHWTCDLTAPQELRDAAGNCHGTLEGEPATDLVRPGIFGNAIRFDAGRWRIRIPHHENLSLRNHFTVEVVLKPDRIDGFRTILWKGDRTATPELINYTIDLRDGRPELKAKDAEGRWLVFSTPTALAAARWHHLVITYREGTAEIFVNGEACPISVSEDGTRLRELLVNDAAAVIGDGADRSGTAYSFCGLIDELRIFAGRELGMLDGDYATRWRALREDCARREAEWQQRRERRAAAAQQALEQDYDALFRDWAIRPDAPFAATVLPASERLNGAPDFFRDLGDLTRTAVCSAARGEFEGFQVILLGRRDGEAARVTAIVSDLVHANGRHRIPAEQLLCGRLQRVTTEEPDIPVAFVGPIPDAILPDGEPATVPPGDFGAAYCRIETGNAPPGLYRGRLTLSGAGHTETVEIALTVYDFELPRRASLRTAFAFFDTYYRAWYELDTISPAQREAICEFLLRYRLSPCNIYAPDAPFPDLATLEKYRDRITFFTIGRIRAGTDDEIREQVDQRVALLRRIRELGLGPYMAFYSFDELSMHMEHLPDAERVTRALRAAWPKLGLMQTSFPIEELRPLFNVWVPLLHEFADPERLRVIQRMRARGDRIWWYAADAPRHPCPNLFLDYPVLDGRMLGILSYLHGVEGMLYWCINREWQTNLDIRDRWPHAPWKSHIYHAHTGKRKYKNGMGNLVYPGANGKLYPSLRLENLRDGLEDYEYLHALERLTARLETAQTADASATLAEARRLLPPPADLATAVNKWSPDPKRLRDYRDRVARVIERATGALRAQSQGEPNQQRLQPAGADVSISGSSTQAAPAAER